MLLLCTTISRYIVSYDIKYNMIAYIITTNGKAQTLYPTTRLAVDHQEIRQMSENKDQIVNLIPHKFQSSPRSPSLSDLIDS